MFKPVKTKKVYEEIIGQIKKLIIDGKLQPGDKLLSERELAETLDVSRASVREAFSALEIMGIITIRPGEGSFVRQVSYEGMMEPLSFFLQVEIDDLFQLLEVRKILEIETAALAAMRATPEDLEDIKCALASMLEEVNTGGIGEHGDAAFHFSIAKAANNPVLIKVMHTITDLLTKTFRTTRQKMFLIENMPTLLHQSHYEIYEAITAHNPRLARRKMQEHLSLVESVLAKIKKGELDTPKMQGDSKKLQIPNEDYGFPS
ncbi:MULTISPECIES: FadR/GntR family transcriptional regulator [Sporomusa]|jgi:GntR family transcriptional repressor for pyruvate dehydrogenase complex|uniref:HTH-type transcriptional regulator LutR n=2 Tax=Sporomusa TaxID=2375 RepID=A0ABM9W7C0_9FIRM|nr:MULTISPECIES: FadR/GntR family transcriptional regulator [Sporomusa]MCM0760706.1 FadR family transcriptional regulator [Sporomusa sphaeroides DSM 2875]OLS57812.1 HTH-type transcriptional regulator LutR [Sporomusa sphaeroides DSM 2875]CVK20973.1 HTH-type transcriptional regulator LutR [Sporomusa sphaeroides DSM 2875]SCM80812.1 HTH-type transcriptional regulator LutR [uncultured Sporomusa sp.]HML34829.1 FadR/GntR family transcriptional regulator [Sporomusa sphaeroides]